MVASHLIDPCAISYWSALNYWQFTEQIPTTVFVQSTKRKLDKEVLGVPFKFVCIPDKKFFGLTTIWLGEKKVQITDKEKTVIDCLDRPKYCGGIIETAKSLVHGIEAGIDLEILTNYATQMNNSVVIKRLGYLAELFQLPVQGFADRWGENIGAGYSLLEPSGNKTGRHYSRWNLQINVSEDELTS